MNLTEEQLSEIETMAGLFFSVDEICQNLELDEEETEYHKTCVEVNGDYAFVRAYKKGRLTTEVQLRNAIKQAAMNGSNPAQSTMMELLNKSKL